jgi:hypothetical protein
MTEIQLWMVYGEQMMSQLHQKLKDDCESLEDDLCIEQPAALLNEDNVRHLQEIVCLDHHHHVQVKAEKVFMLSSEGYHVFKHFV